MNAHFLSNQSIEFSNAVVQSDGLLDSVVLMGSLESACGLEWITSVLYRYATFPAGAKKRNKKKTNPLCNIF